MNIYSDSITENAIKVDDEVTSDVDRPPRLPPRPLNRPVRMINSTNSDAGNFDVLIINYGTDTFDKSCFQRTAEC